DVDRNTPSANTCSKGKGKGKARMVTPEISSDDDVVFVSWSSKAGSSCQPTVQNEATVENKAQETHESLMEFYRKQEHLNCSICLEIVNRPYVLWCGHFFCAGCLNIYATALADCSDKPTCPTSCSVHGRFNPIESHALQQQAYELREVLHLPQPERGTLAWPLAFKATAALPYPLRPDNTLFMTTFSIPQSS
ncbi:hypothetical protein EV361DRAFT_874156, partial [Lentinula raphanica]